MKLSSVPLNNIDKQNYCHWNMTYQDIFINGASIIGGYYLCERGKTTDTDTKHYGHLVT